MPRAIRTRPAFLATLAAAAVGCPSEQEANGFEFIPATPHERYEYAFRQVGLERTVLGYRWIAASFAALDAAPRIEPPFNEVGFFDPHRAQSFGFRFEADRGQALIVTVETEAEGPEVFIDLFRATDNPDRPFTHVAYADSGSAELSTMIRRTGEYAVRVQPEMLGEGRYEITVRLAASLAFPVQGHDTDAIRSRWGAPRDGGRRQHQGVDIFAPRGTPVVASSDGVVSSTRSNRLGGLVVWLRTPHGQSLYHAHLDSVHVRRGRRVRVGDTLGFVGNSGNARTTPPHLHFGVYARGATDPLPFIYQPPQTPPRLVADASRLGVVSRPVRSGVPLRAAPSRRGPIVTRLEGDVPITVLGAAGAWYRVLLPDSTVGFLGMRDLDGTGAVLARHVVDAPALLRAWPRDSSASAAAVGRGDRVEILGRFNDRVLVRVADGAQGWMPETVTAGEALGAGAGES